MSENGLNNFVLFNGTNTDEKSKVIYEEWLEKNGDSKTLLNNKSTNMRSAIIDCFKSTAEIMISTEAGAEGLNLQFCSMIINYDLPWNPQRVEQRIGRCHRYGQRNDVIVINFLNESNLIDNRIYVLLQNKFRLFDDVFGASDDILGRIDDDMNFERKIFNIYSNCRTQEQIDKAFDDLQNLYGSEITDKLEHSKQILLENFDQDIQSKFDSILISAEKQVNEFEHEFWRICKYALSDYATFKNDLSFNVFKSYKGLNGVYTLNAKQDQGIQIRMNDRIGSIILEIVENNFQGREIGYVKFDLSSYKFKISELNQIIGHTGVLKVEKLEINSFDTDQSLLISGRLENGTYLDQETCEKLFRLDSYESEKNGFNSDVTYKCTQNIAAARESSINQYSEKNNYILKEETLRISNWANDKIESIQLKVEQLREKRNNLQKESDYSTNIDEKKDLENQIIQIGRNIKNMWLELADNEDSVDL